MRICAAVLILAGVLRADAESDVRSLVEELSDPAHGARRTAFNRLARYGEEIIPILKRLESTDPEVTRLLRVLTRAARKVRITADAPAGPQALGGPLVLDVRIVNDTDETYHLPLTRNSGRGTGTKSAIYIHLEGRSRERLLPDQVEWIASDGPAPIVPPGHVLHLRLTLTGESSPLRRPGAITVGVGYENVVQRWPGIQRRDRSQVERFPVTFKTDPLVISAFGRKPAELEKALQSNDPKTRVMAVAELALREDAAVLPLLRRHAGERDLTLAAIRRLGAKAKDEDFDFIYKATRNPDANVRVAAVRALASYPRRKARSKLIGLAQDHELKVEAIRALRRHKHPVTIDLFIRLLRQRTSDHESIRLMCAAIHDWTDMPLQDRGSEIRRFERWWSENRARWTKKNLQR